MTYEDICELIEDGYEEGFKAVRMNAKNRAVMEGKPVPHDLVIKPLDGLEDERIILE